MKRIMKPLMNDFCTGVVIGTVISVIFSSIFGQGQYSPVSPVSLMGRIYEAHLSEPLIMLIAAVIWGMIGVLFGLASMIYDASDWSLLKKTVLHIVICYIGFLPLAILAGWFPLTLADILFFTGIFIFVYAIIWTVNYFKNKALVDMINKKLNQ